MYLSKVGVCLEVRTALQPGSADSSVTVDVIVFCSLSRTISSYVTDAAGSIEISTNAD
jgi:hypothetical protein